MQRLLDTSREVDGLVKMMLEATQFNERQVEMIHKLLWEFVGKLHSSKWAKMTKVHRDTARRDIQDLIEKGVLSDTGEGGRSSNYILNLPSL